MRVPPTPVRRVRVGDNGILSACCHISLLIYSQAWQAWYDLKDCSQEDNEVARGDAQLAPPMISDIRC